MDNLFRRIKYLDLLRVSAIFMMVQGHTVDTFLSLQFRSSEYFLYNLWVNLRAYTAPVFFFTSGAVLSWVLSNTEEVKYYKRVKKGFVRALELILIGYLLRFPSHKVFDFSHVTNEGWKIFFTVDALHLISCGVFLILVTHFVFHRFRVNTGMPFLIAAILVVLFSGTINEINWKEIVSYPVAGYFYFEIGSYFPLFPYLTYIFLGAFIGTTIRKENLTQSNLYFLISGVILTIIPLVFDMGNVSRIVHISGVLLILTEIYKKISTAKFINFSKICLISDKSLLIYVVHLVILYGCAWFPGFYKIAGQKFSVEITLIFVILMLILSYSLVIFTDRFFKKKQMAK